MITVMYAPTFVRIYKGIEPALKEEIKEKIEQFRYPKNHTTLKVHKLHGRLKNTYSFTVNYKIRIVFEYENEGKNKKIAFLLYVGPHDGVYA
jgi:plasmid maintenance system killer protein